MLVIFKPPARARCARLDARLQSIVDVDTDPDHIRWPRRDNGSKRAEAGHASIDRNHCSPPPISET